MGGRVALSLNPPKSHLSHEKNLLTFHYTVCLMLLMVQKSHSQPPGMYKKPVNNGIKLPTSTGAGSQPSAVGILVMVYYNPLISG